MTVPWMSFTVVTCLRMTDPCLKVAEERWKDEQRDAVDLADVGQSRDTHRAASAPHLSSASSVFASMIRLSLPGSSAPAAAPSLPSDAHPSASTISAQTPPRGPSSVPLAGQPRRDLAAGDHPPVLPSAGTTTSTELEARLPVQESVSRARVGWGHKDPFWTFGLGMGSL